MYWQTIIIAICFVVSVAFIVTMAFVSPFFKKYLQTNSGLVLNLIWLILIVIVFAATAFSSERCLRITGDQFGTGGTHACMRNVIIWVVLALTILMISYITLADIVYRVKQNKKEKENNN